MKQVVLGGKAFWDELNRMYYEKFPKLREIACETCGQVYRDHERCPSCGHSRRKQLYLPESTQETEHR